MPPKKKTNQEPSCKKDCDSPNPYANRSRRENEQSRRSYEKLRDEHKQKLEDYKANPEKYDNKGTLRSAPKKKVRDRIYEGRVRELERQIQKHESELQKIEKALENQ